MMLSRVADSMFWMSRYIERAENIARFIDVNTYMQLDLGDSVGEQWRPLVAITGDEGTFREKYPEPSRENVMRFLTFDESYPNSLVNCLAIARENARIIRENISTAMWEVINKFYLLVREEAAKGQHAHGSEELYTQVRTLAQLFVGVTDGTLSHGEGWHFARMGRLIERADKTSRILDVRYFLLLPKASDVGTPLDVVQWSALLRSTSALDMYRAKHGRLSPSRIAEFLLLDADFPRAVRHCVDVAERSLRSITGTPVGTFHNSAEKTLGRLRSELDYAAIDDVFHEGLHEFIDRLQRKLNDVGDAIGESLLKPTITMPPQAGQSQTQTQSSRGARSQ